MDKIKPADGKLGVLCVGLGAVTTTLITGTLMARKGLANPIGSFAQMGKMRVGRGEKRQYKYVGEIVPMANLNDVVSCGMSFPTMHTRCSIVSFKRGHRTCA